MVLVEKKPGYWALVFKDYEVKVDVTERDLRILPSPASRFALIESAITIAVERLRLKLVGDLTLYMALEGKPDVRP